MAENIFLLHGRGGRPDGSVKLLQECLEQYYPGKASLFNRPRLLHSDPSVRAETSLDELRKLDIPRQSVLVGISLGGLIAAKLQEVERGDLDVICLNTPTWVDDVRLERRMPNRLAFYSSNDPVIHERTADWPKLATAYNLPWIDQHDTDPYRVLLALLIFAYLNGDSVAHALAEVERHPRG